MPVTITNFSFIPSENAVPLVIGNQQVLLGKGPMPNKALENVSFGGFNFLFLSGCPLPLQQQLTR